MPALTEVSPRLNRPTPPRPRFDPDTPRRRQGDDQSILGPLAKVSHPCMPLTSLHPGGAPSWKREIDFQSSAFQPLNPTSVSTQFRRGIDRIPRDDVEPHRESNWVHRQYI